MSDWRSGGPIKGMETHNGAPKRFIWQGQTHTVSDIADVWRIDDSWWQQRVWQDRYKLVTTTGLLVIVAHDLVSDEWWVIHPYD